jgi:O-antigen/teichoic acid export membrane protein
VSTSPNDALTTPSLRPTTARLAGNALVQAVGTVVASLISVVTFAAITRYLGPGGYGDYAAATSFVLIPTVIADLGLSAAVLRDISAAPARTEALVGASLPFRAGVAVVALGITVACAWAFPFDEEIRQAVLIAAIGGLLTLMTLSLLPVLQARLQMQWAVLATVAGRLVALGATLIVLEAGLGLNGVVAAAVSGLAVTFLIVLLAVSRRIHLRPRIDFDYWRRLLGTSVVLGAAIALGQIYFRIDTVIVAVLRPATEVGLYAAAYKFLELAEVVAAAVAVSIFPTLARFAAERDPRLHAAVQRTFEVLLAAAAPITVVCAAIPATLLGVLAGHDFTDAATALRILAFYPLLAFTNGLLWRLLVAAHLEKTLLRVSLLVLGLNVALNFALIPAFGYLVAAVTSLASEALSVGVVLYIARRRMNYTPGLRYLAVVLPAAAVMAAIVLLLPGPDLVAAALGALVYTILLACLPGTVHEVTREALGAAQRKLAR